MASIGPVSLDESNTKKKSDLAKNRVQELLLQTSAHGIPRLLRTKNVLFKLIWLLALISSSIIGFCLIYKNVFEFLEFGTTTTLTLVDENQAELPTITMCSSGFRASLNETVSFLFFSQKPLNAEKYFEFFEDPNFRRCLRFNSGKNLYGQNVPILRTSLSGVKYSVWFYVNVTPLNGADFTEVFISFQNKSSHNFDLADKSFIMYTGGVFTYKIDRVFHEQLDQPYNNCFKDLNDFKMNRSLIDLILSSNVSYTQKNCFRLCSYMFAIEKSDCRCNSKIMNFEQDCQKEYIRWLEKDSIKDCITEYLTDFLNNKVRTYCSKYCPLECDSVDLIITPLAESLPSNGVISNFTKYQYLLSKYETYEQVKKQFLAISVYYESLKYSLISQQPKTTVYNCISNIGGVIGLCLGISLLSFIEIFEIIFEVIVLLFKRQTS